MDVKLISFTPNAVDVLLFTKATRLNMTPALLQEIADWPEERKMEELAYMADTIPSSWEFVDYTFLVQGVSRAYTHQQVRTRAASYAQQSMRVVDMEGFSYIFTERNKTDPRAMEVLESTLNAIQYGYSRLRELGQAAEDARGILPTNVSTNIVCKFNLRTFCDLAKSRTGGRTQGEYIAVVNAMIDAVLEVHPWARMFLFNSHDRDYFAELERFAEEQFGGDLAAKGRLLKLVDKMRQG